MRYETDNRGTHHGELLKCRCGYALARLRVMTVGIGSIPCRFLTTKGAKRPSI
jgi:hypothetical protein